MDKSTKFAKNKGELPCPPSANIPDLCVLPRSTDAGQNISQTTDTQIMIPISISQNEPFVAPCNQITDSSASQRPQDATTTTVSLSSNIKLQTSPQSTKKHKIDIKLKKKNYHDENEESKKSIYICCLPKGLSNDMMKKLLLVCGEVEEFHREIIDGVEAESCVVKFQEMETVFKSYHVLNEFCILDSMLIVAVLNEKLFNDEDKEIDENGILETKSAIDLLKLDIEMEIRKQNTELSSSKRLSDDDDDDDAASKKFKVDNDNEIYGPDCTDIEISNLDIDIGKTLMVPLLEKCGGVVKWRHKDDKIVFKYKNKQSAAIASQLLRGLRIPDKYIQVNILSKEAENMEAMEVDKGKKNTMKSWLNQAIVANQEEFVNHLQKLCAMYRCNDFDPFAYKTKMCLEAKCTGNCESYHIPEKKDRRRDPRIYNYSDIECKNIRDGKHCPDGDMCSKSHTKNEREFHESRIHTSICQNWENTKKKCEKNKLCISAHPGLVF
ncbi:unnamed protein product [Meganyctiphanes norvegica]|uniref:C3H1-type domain-containing protein n=1 Tax=Meganyctiphanes norvegica TaxID=48144 RepID=A0AAV2PRJ5_MEGNR